MSADVRGAATPEPMPDDPAELEQAIQRRRDALAATIDELTTRASPRELARRGVAGARQQARTVTHTDEGQLRTERLGAVAGAVTVVGALLFLLRRRRR